MASLYKQHKLSKYKRQMEELDKELTTLKQTEK